MKYNSSYFKKGYTPWNKGTHESWTKGKPLSSETRRKLSISHKGMHNSPSTEFKKGTFSNQYLRQIGLKGVLTQQSKNPTSIEKIVYDYLVLQGIIFEKQKLINGKFVVDAYIPSLNLVIEADGKYWHSLDRVVKRDKAKNAYLTKCGFKMVRLSEDDIRNGKFKERLVI